MAGEQNPGFAAGIAQRSKAQRLAWALMGAPKRKKDLRLNSIGAVAEGRKLRDRITKLMQDAGLSPEDAMVFCVFAEPDLSALAAPDGLFLPVHSVSVTEEIELVKDYALKLPVGFVVIVGDRNDPQKPIYGHARPLIVEDKRGPLLNELALHTYKAGLRFR